MSKLKIVSFGNPVLREKAKPITVFHKKLHQTIDSMYKALKSVKDGAAVAAPQLDISKQITVIDYEGEYLELINPEIIELKGSQTDFEGCLSYSGFVGKVTRADYVKVKFQNRNGEYCQIERTGKMARCLQHEIDHLNGILFIDRMQENYLIHQEVHTKVSLQSVKKMADGDKGKISIFE